MVKFYTPVFIKIHIHYRKYSQNLNIHHIRYSPYQNNPGFVSQIAGHPGTLEILLPNVPKMCLKGALKFSDLQIVAMTICKSIQLKSFTFGCK